MTKTDIPPITRMLRDAFVDCNDGYVRIEKQKLEWLLDAIDAVDFALIAENDYLRDELGDA